MSLTGRWTVALQTGRARKPAPNATPTPNPSLITKEGLLSISSEVEEGWICDALLEQGEVFQTGLGIGQRLLGRLLADESGG